MLGIWLARYTDWQVRRWQLCLSVCVCVCVCGDNRLLMLLFGCRAFAFFRLFDCPYVWMFVTACRLFCFFVVYICIANFVHGSMVRRGPIFVCLICYLTSFCFSCFPTSFFTSFSLSLSLISLTLLSLLLFLFCCCFVVIRAVCECVCHVCIHARVIVLFCVCFYFSFGVFYYYFFLPFTQLYFVFCRTRFVLLARSCLPARVPPVSVSVCVMHVTCDRKCFVCFCFSFFLFLFLILLYSFYLPLIQYYFVLLARAVCTVRALVAAPECRLWVCVPVSCMYARVGVLFVSTFVFVFGFVFCFVVFFISPSPLCPHAFAIAVYICMCP